MRKKTKRYVAFALNIKQVRCYIKNNRKEKHYLLIILIDNVLLDKARILYRTQLLNSSSLKFIQFDDYLGNDEKEVFFKQLALICADQSTTFFSYITKNFAHSANLPPFEHIQQELQSHQMLPFMHNVFLSKKIIDSERPNEVWVCAKKDWKYTILHPQRISLTKNIDYKGSGVESLILASKSASINVRFFNPSTMDKTRYFFTRKIRPLVIKTYRQLQLFKTKLSLGFKKDNKYYSKDNRNLVLALVRSPVHAKQIKPVMTELYGESWNTCIITDVALAVRQRAFVTGKFPTIELAKEQKFNLYQANKNINRLISWVASHKDNFPRLSYQNIELNAVFYEVFLQLIHKYCEAISINYSFSKILDTYSPSLVLFANDQELPSRCLADLCAKRKIPTLTIQHGLMAMPPLHFIPVVTDGIAVMGQESKDMLIQFGTPSEKVFLTGLPGFDIKKSSVTPDQIHESSAITLITQLLPAFYDEYFNRFLQLAQSMPNEEFIIKVAPQESHEKYRNNISNIRIESKASLNSVLIQSKIVIGFNSTALLEAMLFEIPVIVMDLFFEHANPYVQAAVCLNLKSDWSLVVNEMLISKRLYSDAIEKQNRFLEHMIHKEKGAAKRIAELAQSLSTKQSITSC